MKKQNMALPDSRNEKILIYIDGELYPREDAKISVFDSSVQVGDAVWEGIRVYDGKIFLLEEHLDRLINSAKVLAYEGIPDKALLRRAIFGTLEANGMDRETHIRLTLTRGRKIASGMNPKWNQEGTTLIVLPEWKKPIYRQKGLKLITSSIRRNSPQCLDSKIHHINLLNNILAKIEANLAGADSAVMLDVQGYLSETNGTNIFLVKAGELLTPFADSCLPGTTRNLLLKHAAAHGLSCREKNLSMVEMYTADEIFVTGTEGELAPVLEVDGRIIGTGNIGGITQKVQNLHAQWVEELGEKLPFTNA